MSEIGAPAIFADIGDLSTRRRDERLPLRPRLAAAAMVCLALAIGGHVLLNAKRPARGNGDASGASASSEFKETDAPAIFDFGQGADTRGGRLEKLASADGERMDAFSARGESDGGPLLRIVARVGANAAARRDLFLVAAKDAASVGGSIEHMTEPEPYSGRRAKGEWSAVTLTVGGASKSCLAFQLLGPPTAALSVLACPSPSAGAADRKLLECILDRLALTPSGAQSEFAALIKGPPASRAPACRGLAS